MPPDVHQPTAAELFMRVLDALVPISPVAKHIPATWPQAWSEVRSVYGPVRSALLVSAVIVSYPFLLVWGGFWILIIKLVVWVVPVTSADQTVAIMEALLLTAVLGAVALWIWGWPGLLVVCLFVWLFTLIRQNQKSKSTAPQ